MMSVSFFLTILAKLIILLNTASGKSLPLYPSVAPPPRNTLYDRSASADRGYPAVRNRPGCRPLGTLAMEEVNRWGQGGFGVKRPRGDSSRRWARPRPSRISCLADARGQKLLIALSPRRTGDDRPCGSRARFGASWRAGSH